jgi:LuxR family maltose regulon positive regulatory protein
MDSPHGETVAGLPLLATKFHVPGWRPGFVSRPRLVAALDRHAGRKLTLVSGSAGFGKTTLLAEWLTAAPASERTAAWVSLDSSDNDPALFWTYVITALQTLRPGVGEQALGLLQLPQPPPIASILTTVINDISAVERDITLVLDDFHVIDAQPIHAAVAFLLDHLPPRMRLVIASRADPPLPLARLRARGESTELRAADLRFTAEEAAAFLNGTMGLDLSAGDVAALETRIEGWIAGLQLAALSIQGRTDVSGYISAFAGDNRYVMDYLVEEVLQRQPDGTRRFLLETSILDRLSGALCDAVTGRNDGKRVLEHLERGNLFVVPLDDTRHWYRYHHLFADVLRAHVTEEQPDRVPALRRRAAAWFEGHGMATEAIDQARAADDHETVARLLVANVDAFERTGQYASIARWAASLPDDMVRTRPQLALIHASVAMGTEPNLATARRLTSWAADAIEAIEAGGAGYDPLDDVDGTIAGSEGLNALKGEVLAQNLMHSARHLPPDEVAGMVEQALALLPPGKHRVRGILHRVRAGIQVERSDPEAALATLDQSADEARRTQNYPLLACILEHRGQVSVAMGRLDDGRRSFEEAIAAWQHGSVEGHWTICGTRARLAEVLLERGDLTGATEHVATALARASASPMRSPLLYLRAIAADVLLAAGDTNGAIEQLDEAQAFALGVRTFRFAAFLSSVQLTIHCCLGDLDAAAAVVRERGLSPDAAVDDTNEEEMIAYARYLIARGDHGEAAGVLSRVLPVVQRGGRIRHEIHALTLQALAYESSGNRPRALESLGRATMLGEPGRFNRTFTGEGPVMSGLVMVLADAVRRGRGPAETGSPSYLAVLAGATRVKPEPTLAKPVAAGLAEPLTAREVEVLRLIAVGLRNEEIAGRLFVGLSTVKRHIANAYGKLGVDHRTEAVARANELHLL